MMVSVIPRTREDFPLLQRGIIYLDSASTSLTPKQVIEKMLEYYQEYRANVGRGLHSLTKRATEEYERAREKVASFIGTKPSQVIFTKNTTEAINSIAAGIKWKKGDKVITTLLEHHSNLLPWLRLRERGVKVEVVKPRNRGVINAEDFKIDRTTKLVSITHASNVLGTILPVEEICELAHEQGALVLVDGAQSVPHLPVNVKRMDCDFLAFSGHKMLGPTGIGVLFSKHELEPLCLGGGTVKEVTLMNWKLLEGPAKFEAGTPPIAQAIGLGAAVDYLRRIGMDRIREHELFLTKLALKGLQEIEGVTVYGPKPEERVGIVPFNVAGKSPDEVALLLDSKKIEIRSGHHCAIPLHREFLGVEGTARASFYLYNTKEEIESFVEAVAEMLK
jgi:cysteine desulfurase/selenocysteine lyase